MEAGTPSWESLIFQLNPQDLRIFGFCTLTSLEAALSHGYRASSTSPPQSGCSPSPNTALSSFNHLQDSFPTTLWAFPVFYLPVHWVDVCESLHLVRGPGISRQVFRLRQPKIKIRICLGISALGETAEFPVTPPEINDQLILKRLGKKALALPRGDKMEEKGGSCFPSLKPTNIHMGELLNSGCSHFWIHLPGQTIRGLHSDSSNSMLFPLHYILNYLLAPIPTVAPAPYHNDSKLPV